MIICASICMSVRVGTLVHMRVYQFISSPRLPHYLFTSSAPLSPHLVSTTISSPRQHHYLLTPSASLSPHLVCPTISSLRPRPCICFIIASHLVCPSLNIASPGDACSITSSPRLPHHCLSPRLPHNYIAPPSTTP